MFVLLRELARLSQSSALCASLFQLLLILYVKLALDGSTAAPATLEISGAYDLLACGARSLCCIVQRVFEGRPARWAITSCRGMT